MNDSNPAAQHSGLVYEKHGNCPEAWVRVTMERTTQGPRVVIEEGTARYSLRPTAYVLEGITRNLRGITARELATGAAVLGPVGARALERLTHRAPLAA